MTVDPIFAQWLQGDAEHAILTDAVASGRWGATGITSERVTGIGTQEAASAEAQRQLAFFGQGPFAVDKHQIAGDDWIMSLGLVVTIETDQLGYDGGVDVFVIGAEPDRATGLSVVTVLRPLRAAA